MYMYGTDTKGTVDTGDDWKAYLKVEDRPGQTAGWQLISDQVNIIYSR